ncbi:biotin/lipoate A/B protein ligase family protein, partial [Streptococcus suis]|uniref:lipoate--protein ligase family protein n=1 Tax=Streptococcus suis TaxID=1307 RepID=UPI00137A4CCA
DLEIGKFQNALVEINEDYLKENNILLVRRDTGGGAIYVDKGSVNVCYLIQDNGIFGDFKRAYQPAIKALHELGAVEVEQTGRNDLVIEGKKVSGAAMTIS